MAPVQFSISNETNDVTNTSFLDLTASKSSPFHTHTATYAATDKMNNSCVLCSQCSMCNYGYGAWIAYTYANFMDLIREGNDDRPMN